MTTRSPVKRYEKESAWDVTGREENEMPKPKVLSVEKEPVSSSGNTKPGSYDAFTHSRNMKKLFNGPRLTAKQVIQYALQHYPKLQNQFPTKGDMWDVKNTLRDNNIGISDNTYNWGWWGPTMNFTLIGPATKNSYKDGVLIVSRHLGGDVRGNYEMPMAFRLENYSEDVPWYDIYLYVSIKTDQGTIKLDSTDTEAYYFYISKDETETWNQGDDINYNDLKEELNWEEVLDLW